MSNRFNSLPKSSAHSAEEVAAHPCAEEQERYDAWFTEANDGQDQDKLYQETMESRFIDDYNTMKDSILGGSVAVGTNERANPKGRQAFYLAEEIRKARLKLGDADKQSEEYLQLVTAREDKLEAILSRSEEPFRVESSATRALDNLSDEEADFIIDYSGGKYDAILDNGEDNDTSDESIDNSTETGVKNENSESADESAEAAEKDDSKADESESNDTDEQNDDTSEKSQNDKDRDQRIDLNMILRSAYAGEGGKVNYDQAEEILTRMRAALDAKRQKDEKTTQSIDDDVEPLQNVNSEQNDENGIDDDVEPLKNSNSAKTGTNGIDNDVEPLQNVNIEGIDDDVEPLQNEKKSWLGRMKEIFSSPENAMQAGKDLFHTGLGASSQIDRWSKEKIKEHPKAAVAIGVVAIAGIYLARREFSDGGNTFAAGTYESGGFEDQLADGTISMDSGLEDAGDIIDTSVDDGGSVNAKTDLAAGDDTASEAVESDNTDSTNEIDAMVDSFSVEAKTVTGGEGGFKTLDQIGVPKVQQETIWEQIGNELTDTGQGDLVYRNEDDENRWGWNKSLVLSDKAQRTVAEVIQRNQ